MVKLVIDGVLGYQYILKDSKNNFYEINIEFYDIEKIPGKGDILYIHEKLLRQLNHRAVSFGKLDGVYGKVINDENSLEVIAIQMGQDMIYLKRYYG